MLAKVSITCLTLLLSLVAPLGMRLAMTLTVQSVRGRFRWDSYYSRDRGDSSPTSTVERTWNLEQANHARRSAAAPEVRRGSREAGTAVIQVPLNP